LVVPILFLILIGTIDVGRMLISRSMLQYAVISGARAGLAKTNSTTAAVQTATAAAAPMLHLTATNVNVCVDTVGTCTGVASSTAWTARTTGDTVTVSYSGYTFTPASGSFARLTTKSLAAASTQTIP
jgi:Flp pilus assembly protein TadG